MSPHSLQIRFASILLALTFAVGCTIKTAPPPATATAPEPAPAPAPAPPPKESPPDSLAPREIQFPKIARSTTGAGLELNTVEMHQLPIVQIKLVIKSGSAADPKALPGLAQLTASMLKEGTLRRNSKRIAESIDFLGANLHVSNDESTVTIDMRALSEHFDEALALVAELATKPKFDDKELAKLKKRELARLSLQSQQPRFLAAREFYRTLYGDHPYAHIETTPAVVKRVKRSDLVTFHRRHFGPNNAFLVVVGDVTSVQVEKGAAKAFKGWHKRRVPKIEFPEPPVRTQREVLIVDRPQSVQSVIYYGNLAIQRSNPDYIPLMVANQVLGGSAASRLFMDLREKRSLTYGAYSTVSERVQVAPFISYAAVRNEVTAEAMSAFTEHLDRIVVEAAPTQELGHAQRFLVDRFPLRIDTAGKIAGLVSDLRVYDLPDDYWDGFRSDIGKVGSDAALAAAKKHIRPNKSLIVVVGKAADIKPALEAYGPVTVIDTDGKVIVKPSAAPVKAADPAQPQQGAQPAPAPAAVPTATP